MFAGKRNRLLTALALVTVPFLMQSTCSIDVPYGESWYYDDGYYDDGFYVDVWIEDDYYYDDCCYDDYYFGWDFFDWVIDWY